MVIILQYCDAIIRRIASRCADTVFYWPICMASVEQAHQILGALYDIILGDSILLIIHRAL
jgi:hypothetical protein